jgi:hypothetical protein
MEITFMFLQCTVWDMKSSYYHLFFLHSKIEENVLICDTHLLCRVGFMNSFMNTCTCYVN